MPALRLVCPLAVVPTALAGCGAPPLDIRGLRVVPGGVGSCQVTAHRTSSTRAETRRTPFRSERSLAERAAVPGHPGRTPRRATITLSTCATPEDHAVGNCRSEAFDNPEHRIDKFGVLVRTARR